MCGCIFRSLSTCARQQEYRRLACKNLNARSTLRINLQEDTNRWFFLKFSWLFNFGTFLVLPCPPPMSVASDPFQSWHLSVKPPDSNIQDSNIYIFSKMSGSVQFGAMGVTLNFKYKVIHQKISCSWVSISQNNLATYSVVILCSHLHYSAWSLVVL